LKFYGNDLEWLWCLRKTKTIGEVGGGGVCEPERAQLEIGLDKLEQAAEIVSDMRYVRALGVRRDNYQGDAKTVLLDGVRTGPDGARRRRIVAPSDSAGVEQERAQRTFISLEGTQSSTNDFSLDNT